MTRKYLKQCPPQNKVLERRLTYIVGVRRTYRLAIKCLEKEHDILINDLNAATCNLKMKEDEKYKAKFTKLLHETRRMETELNKQRQTEDELDKEIVKIEHKLVNLASKTKKEVDENPLLPNTVSNSTHI